MPLNKKDSPATIMHELKATRKSTKNPSRKAAARNGTSHEQEVAILMNTKGKGKKSAAPAVKSPARNIRKAAK
jgi:hypothetical protein